MSSQPGPPFEQPPKSGEAHADTMMIGELDDILGYLLRLSLRASNRKVLPVFRAHGFTGAEVTTLMIIAYNPDRPLRQIADAVGVELPATQRIVNALYEKKYVTRRRPEKDKRQTLYRATSEGIDQMNKVKELANAQDRTLLAGLTPAERAELFRMLRIIGRNQRDTVISPSNKRIEK